MEDICENNKIKSHLDVSGQDNVDRFKISEIIHQYFSLCEYFLRFDFPRNRTREKSKPALGYELEIGIK